MALDFDSLKVDAQTTKWTANLFNSWIKNWDDRLNRIEAGGLAYSWLIPGAVSAGRKLLFKIPTKLVKASFGFTVDGTITTKIIMDIFTGADRDTQGTSMFSNPANRPELDTPDITGASPFKEATAGLILLTSGAVLGLEVDQGAGPNNMVMIMRGEPGA